MKTPKDKDKILIRWLLLLGISAAIPISLYYTAVDYWGLGWYISSPAWMAEIDKEIAEKKRKHEENLDNLIPPIEENFSYWNIHEKKVSTCLNIARTLNNRAKLSPSEILDIYKAELCIADNQLDTISLPHWDTDRPRAQCVKYINENEEHFVDTMAWFVAEYDFTRQVRVVNNYWPHLLFTKYPGSKERLEIEWIRIRRSIPVGGFIDYKARGLTCEKYMEGQWHKEVLDKKIKNCKVGRQQVKEYLDIILKKYRGTLLEEKIIKFDTTVFVG